MVHGEEDEVISRLTVDVVPAGPPLVVVLLDAAEAADAAGKPDAVDAPAGRERLADFSATSTTDLRTWLGSLRSTASRSMFSHMFAFDGAGGSCANQSSSSTKKDITVATMNNAGGALVNTNPMIKPKRTTFSIVSTMHLAMCLYLFIC